METIKQYEEENKRHYEKVKRDLKEIKDSLKYIISEQEQQRITNMSFAEVLQEIQNNNKEIRASLDVLLMETVGDTEWIIN